MQTINRSLSSFAPFGPTVMRVIIGALFLLHGIDKFNNGISGVEGFFADNGVPAAALTAPLTAGLEVVLGAALIAGLFTRVAALVLAAVMIGAIVFVKADAGILGGAELDLAYLAGLTGVALIGPGRFSLDEALNTEASLALAPAQDVGPAIAPAS